MAVNKLGIGRIPWPTHIDKDLKIALEDLVFRLEDNLNWIRTTPYWDDLRVPMTATKLGGTKDPGFAVYKTNGAGSQGVFTYWFDKAAEEELYFSCQLPHSWDGTAISPHIHWIPKTTDASAVQTVRWGIEYCWADINAVFGDTSIIYGLSANTLVADTHMITDFADITPTADQNGISSMLLCRVFRDATSGSDSYDYDAGLLEVDFHFRKDTAGSLQEYIK